MLSHFHTFDCLVVQTPLNTPYIRVCNPKAAVLNDDHQMDTSVVGRRALEIFNIQTPLIRNV